ncbi:L,D-transpeptidase [Amycolatopsis alkalitolerans]|uniref:L,D-transpeptidase n=2 Tax=Amycolatopsis alkalitolerans TaxID=2547244 RepID=A0A5C4M8K1_9PSEU|nr:L,D-transpeptidase [Amycolatopsis alkalitolerans]
MLALSILTALTGWTLVRVSGESAAAPSPVKHPAPVAAATTAPAPPATGGQQAVVVNQCPPSAVACVDEQLRISWLQQDGKVVYGPVPVMPGTAGADDSVATPTGVFHVQWKDAHHVSSEFNEPMTNAVFFAAGGIAFHEGSLVSSSHGCVHLSPADSARYYAALPVGAEVAVF